MTSRLSPPVEVASYRHLETRPLPMPGVDVLVFESEPYTGMTYRLGGVPVATEYVADPETRIAEIAANPQEFDTELLEFMHGGKR